MSLMRIDKLFNFEKGLLQSSKCVPGEFDFITASSDWKTHNEYTHNCEALIFAAAASGSLGRTHYVNGKFISSDLCFIITPKDQENLPVDLKFYHILFNELKDEIVRNTKAGTSKEAIGLGSFGKYQLPYFDIDTQIEIKNRFVNSEDLKSDLSTELTHQLTLVKKLRQQLLQDAVQGKLVEQNKKDEPASELLKKIKAEKAKLIAEKKLKKEKELPPIKPEEIPFEIPKNWVWCRLGEIIYYTENLDIQKHLSENTIINYIDIDAIDNQNQIIREVKQKTVGELSTRARRVLKKGYLMYSTVRPYLKNIAIIELELENFIGSTGFSVFNTIVLDIQYVFSFLLTPKLNDNFKKMMVGFNSPSITNEQFENTVIPLPPFTEQHRIVQKLDELMQYCNELEASIKESESQNEKLLQQVLREALRPASKRQKATI
jgi:type I restriction enzyme S subunit